MSHAGENRDGESRAPENLAPAEHQLRAAAEWRLTALLLARPRPGWREEVESLAREVREPGLHAAAEGVHAASEGAYLRSVGPGGAVSPREVTYRPFEDPGWVLADVKNHYDAFAFHPRAEDPIDHVAVETDFVGYLLLKEAFARARGDADGARVASEARGRFLVSHLATIAKPFAQRVAEIGPAHLAAAALVLAARVPPPPRRPAGLADRPEPPGSLEGRRFCT